MLYIMVGQPGAAAGLTGQEYTKEKSLDWIDRQIDKQMDKHIKRQTHDRSMDY